MGEIIGDSTESIGRGNIQYNLSKFDDQGIETSKRYRFVSMGILEERSSMEDYSIIIPLETARDMLKWLGQDRNFEKEGYDNLKVKVVSLKK